MKMYRLELEDVDGNLIVEFETAETPVEALELMLGRKGMSVKVQEVEFED